MAIGQALLIKPPKLKTTPQQPHQDQKIHQIDRTTILQEQPLQFEQSLELVQTLLGASIGCLSFLRGLLPEECFVEKRYGGKSSAAISYRSFTSDLDDESFKKATASSGTRVKRLRRGYSGEADQLLDWLEIGIFDALKKGYLKAVQLAIYVDKEHPDIIVESYTFSFSYYEKRDGTPTISLRVTDLTGRGVTVDNANKNLQLMMRRLIVITQNLAPLPDQRWLTIRLHYLDHTPSNYDPPSFIRVSASSPSLRFHERETKEVEKLDVGCMDAGFHAVSLKISSMNETDSQENPKQRRGSRYIYADTDIDIPQFIPDASQPIIRVHASSTKELRKEAIVNEHTKPLELSRESLNKLLTANSQVKDSTVPFVNRRATQRAGRNTQEKISLRGMLRPTTRENDIEETQPIGVPHTSGDNSQIVPPNYGLSLIPPLTLQAISNSRDHIIISTNPILIQKPDHAKPNLAQKQDPSYPQKQSSLGIVTATHTTQRQSPRDKNRVAAAVTEVPLARVENTVEYVDKNMAKLELSKAKATELRKPSTNANRRGFMNRRIKNKEQVDHINCECGDEQFEEDMICCDNCDEWQHTDCYGFVSAKDTRIPDYHVCYSCLLGKNEGKLLEEMRNMALFRRALRTIWNQGSFPSSNKLFSNKLGCDLPTALQITRRLETEGFISNDPVKSKIHKKKVYKVIKTDEMKYLMDREYFDPLKKISHHFENPISRNTIRESLLEDTPITRPLSDTIPSSFTIAQNSQEVGNVTEEAIFLAQARGFSSVVDADTESTADEEDNTSFQYNALDKMSTREAVMKRFGNPNHPNTISLGYKNLKSKHKSPSEIAESPEPMEIDVIEESQVPVGWDMLKQGEAAVHGRSHLINVGGVLQDIFVGEELGYREL